MRPFSIPDRGVRNPMPNRELHEHVRRQQQTIDTQQRTIDSLLAKCDRFESDRVKLAAYVLHLKGVQRRGGMLLNEVDEIVTGIDALGEET
jgi:hypothetical protein